MNDKPKYQVIAYCNMRSGGTMTCWMPIETKDFYPEIVEDLKAAFSDIKSVINLDITSIERKNGFFTHFRHYNLDDRECYLG